jgi:hypothetical protein
MLLPSEYNLTLANAVKKPVPPKKGVVGPNSEKVTPGKEVVLLPEAFVTTKNAWGNVSTALLAIHLTLTYSMTYRLPGDVGKVMNVFATPVSIVLDANSMYG